MTEPWIPKVDNGVGVLSAGNSLAPMGQAANQIPQVALPEVGATVWLQVYPYGGTVLIGDDHHAQAGASVLVCEVKEIKKAKITLE